MIIRNRARCKLCGDTIESTSVHDYRCCTCLALCVDGGREYIKRSLTEPADSIHDVDYMRRYVEELSEFAEDDVAMNTITPCMAGTCNCTEGHDG